MSWRCQWRNKTPNGTPSGVDFQDGWDADGAAFKAQQLLASGRVCWIWIEDLDGQHKGNSISKPKVRSSSNSRKSSGTGG